MLVASYLFPSIALQQRPLPLVTFKLQPLTYVANLRDHPRWKTWHTCKEEEDILETIFYADTQFYLMIDTQNFGLKLSFSFLSPRIFGQILELDLGGKRTRLPARSPFSSTSSTFGRSLPRLKIQRTNKPVSDYLQPFLRLAECNSNKSRIESIQISLAFLATSFSLQKTSHNGSYSQTLLEGQISLLNHVIMTWY